MLQTIASATNGQGTIGNQQPEVLRAALAAAQSPELEAEISEHGRGSAIFHAISSQGFVAAKDFATWICLEKKCSRVRGGGLFFSICRRISKEK